MSKVLLEKDALKNENENIDNKTTAEFEGDSKAGKELITETATGVPDKEDTFKPGEFVANLKYMGLGMLGIFVVIGIIIIVTSLLSKIKTKEDK